MEGARDGKAGPRAALISAWIGSFALTACGRAGDGPLTGYIDGEYLRVAGPLAGPLERRGCRRADAVSGGAPLFTLERENETAARREAEERLRAAEARFA